MAIPKIWKLLLGVVIGVLVCSIENTKCCSGGGTENTPGNIFEQISQFSLNSYFENLSIKNMKSHHNNNLIKWLTFHDKLSAT